MNSYIRLHSTFPEEIKNCYLSVKPVAMSKAKQQTEKKHVSMTASCNFKNWNSAKTTNFNPISWHDHYSFWSGAATVLNQIWSAFKIVRNVIKIDEPFNNQLNVCSNTSVYRMLTLRRWIGNQSIMEYPTVCVDSDWLWFASHQSFVY